MMKRYRVGTIAVILLAWLSGLGGVWHLGMTMLTVWCVLAVFDLGLGVYFRDIRDDEP